MLVSSDLIYGRTRRRPTLISPLLSVISQVGLPAPEDPAIQLLILLLLGREPVRVITNVVGHRSECVSGVREAQAPFAHDLGIHG